MKFHSTFLTFWFALISVSCGLSILPPEIKGKAGSNTGKTSHKAVRCLLKKDDLNNGAITGELIVDKNFIDQNLGISLAVWDAEGNLVASWGIQGREIEGKIHYYFGIQRKLIKSAKFDLFTKKKGIMELNLSTLPIIEKN